MSSLRRLLFPLVCLVLLAPGYDWPVKPFHAQHPVRGFFDDPRREPGGPSKGVRESFHTGIDIACADGTPIYAIAAGRASVRPTAVIVRSDGWTHVFGYWHIVPIVDPGSWVRAHQLLGLVLPGWGHVHLSERLNGTYVNPLRRAGIAPFEDTTAPLITDVALLRNGRPVNIAAVTGSVELVADAYDTPPLALQPPWKKSRLTPAVLRWRLIRPNGVVVVPWLTTVDFRVHLTAEEFSSVFAPGTIENRAWQPGRYRFWLAQNLDTRRLPPGVYALQVEAWDMRGNRAAAQTPFRVLAQVSRKTR